MDSFKLDEYHSRWSFSRGATKGTERSRGRANADLAEALAEIDGILAGVNFLEKVEPTLTETSSSLPQSEDSTNSVPANTGEWGRLGHLTFGLSKLDAANGVSPEEKSNIETRHLRNHLSSKLTAPDDSNQRPRASQWATLRSLRQASRYHYYQFKQVTAESTVPRMKKLWKSYDNAKDMLEVGILTFRHVLHGQIPTTVVDIFALASLSYVISKILHAKGCLDESDILSGILDWRAAIADEDERLTFDDIAKQLWPEASEILHFIPEQREGMGHKVAFSVHNDSTYSTPAGEPTLQMDILPSPQEHHENMPQANDVALPLMDDSVYPHNPLQNQIFQLLQETKSHEDFAFSDFLDQDFWDNIPPADPMYQTLYPPIPPDKAWDSFDPYSPQRQCIGDAHSVHSETPTSFSVHCDSSSPAEPVSDKSSPAQSADKPASDCQLDSLKDTPFFKTIAKYMLRGFSFHIQLESDIANCLIEISEQGDLLNVLSGGGLLSKNDRTKSLHSNRPLRALEFVGQALKHIFEPLLGSALRVNETFVGIVAMAETFVNIGVLHTVRGVENYIIAVSRVRLLAAKLLGQPLTKMVP